MTHYGEKLAREFEAAYEQELFRRADAELRAPERPAPSKPSPERLFARLTGAVSCHVGVRAARLCESTQDLQANPQVFRCPKCGMLLDGPVWGESC